MQQRSEETRNAIIEAAETLFTQQGYTAAGVAEICEAAGVSKGAFYHHFETKQAVFLAVDGRPAGLISIKPCSRSSMTSGKYRMH